MPMHSIDTNTQHVTAGADSGTCHPTSSSAAEAGRQGESPISEPPLAAAPPAITVAATTTATKPSARTKRESSKSRHTHAFAKSKGVYYSSDGAVLSCRFCEILRLRDEPFLFEDDLVAVFRPLRPIVASHILIVPRAHIRNIHHLTPIHDALLRHMKVVAERVLRAMPHCDVSASDAGSSATTVTTTRQTVDPLASSSSSVVSSIADSGDDVIVPAPSIESSKGGTDDDEDSCGVAAAAVTLPPHTNHSSNKLRKPSKHSSGQCFKLAFHAPPFNSIDHVHMHAFDATDAHMGVYGRVKYKTKSWWCRSVADVLAHLGGQWRTNDEGDNAQTVATAAAAIVTTSSPHATTLVEC